MSGAYFRLFIFGRVSRDILITQMAVKSIPYEIANKTALQNVVN